MADTFSIKVKSGTVAGGLFVKAPTLTPAQLRTLGGVAIHAMRNRIAAHKDTSDGPLKVYSPKGPVYIPVAGKGRSISSMGGRNALTSKDVSVIRREGHATILNKSGKNPSKSKAKPGAPVGRITASGKSLKFENYSAYKRAIGKSGDVDLEVSGRMLNAIDIVRITPASVAIGFTRESERLKAEGNQRRRPFFGLSPSDKALVMQTAEQIFAVQAFKQMTGVS